MDPEVIGPVLGAMGVGYIVGKELPLERQKELEADCLGLLLAAKAGYDPSTTQEFWKTLAEKQRSNDTFQFLKAHPTSNERYSNINDKCLSPAQTAFNQVEDRKRQKATALIPGVEEVS